MTRPKASVAAGLIARNTLWNLAGQVAPLAAAVICIPLLIRGLAPEGFGLLSLAWMVVGYFSLFDLGLGRALTQLVADRLGSGSVEGIPELVATAMALMLGLGVLGTAAALAATPWAVDIALNVPAGMQAEARGAFRLMAFAVPAVTITAALRGLLEANQRFGVVNALKAPLGVFNFAGPAVTLLFSRRLDVVVAVLAVSRYASAFAHLVACRSALPLQFSLRTPDWTLAPGLLKFGGWMTVSNIVSPLMVYFDRFVIGSLVSMSAVAFYVTPYEIVTKLWAIPAALVAVLFPAFTMIRASDPLHAARWLARAMRYLFVVMFPLTFGILVLAPWGLRIWVGSPFEANSTRVLQWLAAGVFVNSMGYVPFAFVQGAGRPDLTAKLHFAELPVYAAVLWWAVERFGIEGAAIAWFARVAVDTALLMWISVRLGVDRRVLRSPSVAVGIALAWMLAGGLLASGWASLAFLGATYLLALPIFWNFLLDGQERSKVRRTFAGLLGRAA
ncbi:MAG: flippase [Anaeromyxobacteraceae bacterium]